LPEPEYEALKQAAHRMHRSMANCVREAITLYLGRPDNAAADFAAVAGKFRPIPTGDLKPHDRRLAESILGLDPSCKKSS
jgi:hypothetical protein